jgi:hypothetical protein
MIVPTYWNTLYFSCCKLRHKIHIFPISQLAIERRAMAMHHYTRGHRELPDKAIILCSEEDRKRSTRTGHEWELVMPVTTLEAVRSSSLNTARYIWNRLPEDIASIPDSVRFKFAVKSASIYEYLSERRAVRRTETAIG